MKRTTVSLPDELAVAVSRVAESRRISVSELTREALAAHLGIGKTGKRQLEFAKLGASGKRHTSRDVEKILDAEWGRARGR